MFACASVCVWFETANKSKAAAIAQWRFQVQKSWMYLEPIFSAPDIQKQLPAEARAFNQVHRQLRDAARRARERPNALQATSNPSACGLC